MAQFNIISYFNMLKRNRFILDFFTIFSGSLVAQLVSIAASPFLSRIFSPEQFGVYALYLSIVTIIGAISSWQYSNAILLPKKNKDAENIIYLSEFIIIGMSLLSLALVSICRNFASQQLNSSALASWLWFAPLSIFLMGNYEVLNSWCIRKKRFNLTAASVVIASSTQNGVSLSSGILLNPGVGGLVWGQIAGRLVAVFFLFKKTFFHICNFSKDNISLSEIRLLSRRYSKFPKFQTWAVLVNKIAVHVPAIMLAHFFSTQIAGFYFLGNKLLAIPIVNIGASVGKIFFQRASESKNTKGNFKIILRKTVLGLLFVGIMPFLIIGLFGPHIFSFIFGNMWHEAGVYAQILSPLFLITFVVSPISTSLIVSEKQEFNLILQTFYLIAVAAAFYIGGRSYNNIKLSLSLYVVAASIRYFIELFFCFKFASRQFQIK